MRTRTRTMRTRTKTEMRIMTIVITMDVTLVFASVSSRVGNPPAWHRGLPEWALRAWNPKRLRNVSRGFQVTKLLLGLLLGLLWGRPRKSLLTNLVTVELLSIFRAGFSACAPLCCKNMCCASRFCRSCGQQIQAMSKGP